MPCSAVFDGEVCGVEKEHRYHRVYALHSKNTAMNHWPIFNCHPYQEKESPMPKRLWKFTIGTRCIEIGRDAFGVYRMDTHMPTGGTMEITPKALREIADTLEEDTEIIRKTITL